MDYDMLRYLEYTVLVVVVVALISNGVLYYILSTDYNEQISELNESLVMLGAETSAGFTTVGETIVAERQYSEEQRSILEEKTNENFVSLEDYINQKTSTLQLDLEAQLTDVETELAETSEELSGRISQLKVSSSDFTSIIEDSIKAVVSIKTDQGQGSGVIFDSSGYVMTNRHVVEGASAITVVDYDSNQYPVVIKGYATNADLAVLKIDSDDSFDYLRFEDRANVGERVIAVGNPLGLSFTVTEGIVSAVNRQIDDSGVGYLQTDVPINPGNSGGPLINTDGRVVGINTFKLSASEGLGFAVPGELCQEIADQALAAE